ncbi:MAG: peptidoglycan-associated lipoprotein Pal [Gemmatimonadaceae bacterium]|nr:peptidoglycan-associated lipoprotein Pal [Gemmatimonadaceae bacterium]
MLRRSSTLCAMAALLLGGSAAAQSPGTLLVGGFGQYSRYDSKWNLDTGFGNSIGYGGRLGAFIAPSWNLEADGSYTPANARARFKFGGAGVAGGEVKASALTARLMYSFPMANMPSFHVGAGGVLENFRGPNDNSPGTYQFGVNGMAGVNIGFGGFALRLDGFANYLPSNDGKFDFGAQAGLQFTPDLASMMGGSSMMGMNYGPIIWWNSDLAGPLPGTVEVGAFGQYSRFDDNAGRPNAIPKDGIGYGGRVGVFLSDPKWELEGDGYYSPQDNDAPRTPVALTFNRPADVNAHAFAMRLLYNIPLGLGNSSQFIIGAGGTRTSYKFENGTVKPNPSYTYNYGATGDIGVRFGLANRVALRLDGVVDYMPNHKPSANLNLHGRAGLSLLLGGAQAQAMCTYAGLETIPASSPNCVAPPPPPPPPAPVAVAPAMCMYNGNIMATDPACTAPVSVDSTAITAPIYFDYDKSNIRPDAQATLERKLPWLNANPGMRIRIEGNADERGSDEYNLALGQRRAASAKHWLVDHGIAADRFDLVSYGEERPVCTEHNETCWQQNRRDDFRIVTVGSDMIMVPKM